MRYRRRVYSTLRGDRHLARQAVLTELGVGDDLPTTEADGADPPSERSAGTADPPDQTTRKHPRLEAS